jgi:uncharacterized damage-inducible protein DinB
MDEFERAVEELIQLIGGLEDEAFEAVRDSQSPDAKFVSIQTVVNHVVQAGYAHANHVRVAFSLNGARVVVPLGTRSESPDQLRAMAAYLEETLSGRWQLSEEELSAVEIKARWGPTYDLEQMLEHAIVHVLRHRRQIERYLREPQFAAVKAASPDFAPGG